MKQRGGSIVIGEPLRPLRVAIPRDRLWRIIIGVALEASATVETVVYATVGAGGSVSR